MERTKERRTEMAELLEKNLRKVAEVYGKEEEIDPLKVAYLAGRMDGIADQAWMKGRSA